jgi:hypothetical protein
MVHATLGIRAPASGPGRGRAGQGLRSQRSGLAEVVDRKIKPARIANALVSAGFGFVWYSRPPNRTPSASPLSKGSFKQSQHIPD